MFYLSVIAVMIRADGGAAKAGLRDSRQRFRDWSQAAACGHVLAPAGTANLLSGTHLQHFGAGAAGNLPRRTKIALVPV